MLWSDPGTGALGRFVPYARPGVLGARVQGPLSACRGGSKGVKMGRSPQVAFPSFAFPLRTTDRYPKGSVGAEGIRAFT